MFDSSDEIVTQYEELFTERGNCISVGSGWLNIVADVCHCIMRNADITKEYAQTTEEKAVIAYPQVLQVKEKFGGLRFYTNVSNDYINGVIAMAEMQAHRTCEYCGKPGKSTRGGWIKTLCDDCNKTK